MKAKAQTEWDWLENLPQPLIQLGMGTCGRASGADEIFRSVQQTLKDLNLLARTMEVGCIGMCYLEPMMASENPDVLSFYTEI
jgi:NADH-quinone oxidoreductase subunit F